MFGEDVPALFYYAVARKKRLRLLSEERLSPREEKTYGDLRHFFCKKNGGSLFLSPPAILKRILSLKLQNFAVK